MFPLGLRELQKCWWSMKLGRRRAKEKRKEVEKKERQAGRKEGRKERKRDSSSPPSSHLNLSSFTHIISAYILFASSFRLSSIPTDLHSLPNPTFCCRRRRRRPAAGTGGCATVRMMLRCAPAYSGCGTRIWTHWTRVWSWTASGTTPRAWWCPRLLEFGWSFWRGWGRGWGRLWCASCSKL